MSIFFIIILFISNLLSWRIVTRKFSAIYFNYALLYVAGVQLSRVITDALSHPFIPTKEMLRASHTALIFLLAVVAIIAYFNFFFVPRHLMTFFIGAHQIQIQRIVTFTFLLAMFALLTFFAFVLMGIWSQSELALWALYHIW